MEYVPGQKDRSLEVQTVCELIQTQFSSLCAEEIRYLGEGWDFESFEIDESVVFRFPKRREYDAHLLKEIAMLEEIGSHLPIPIPKYKYVGRPSSEFPYHFGGYVKLRGASAMDLSEFHPTDATAKQIGQFLTCLHAIHPEKAAKIAIHPANEQDTIAGRRTGALHDLEYLKCKMDSQLHEMAFDFFNKAANLPNSYKGMPKLLHGDLLSEHILIAPESGQVTGIIDWSDATVGDPAADFAGLWVWQGEEFVTATLDNYGQPVDETMFQRIRYCGLEVAIGNLYYGHVKGEQIYIQDGLNCLQRFFKR